MLYSKRDWGYAKEYALAMWKMLQLKKPEDFVLSTGNTYTIKDFIDECVKYLKLDVIWIGKNLDLKLIDKKTNRAIDRINKKYFRPAEVDYLRGDSDKANKVLKWKAKTNLSGLVKIMIENEFQDTTLNYRFLTISSVIFFASANNIKVLSL